jgi:hypothetical protein
MMHQNLAGCNPSLYSSLLSTLSQLYYLQRFEPFFFTLEYPRIRKALGYGIAEFKAIYTAYVKQRGAK